MSDPAFHRANQAPAEDYTVPQDWESYTAEEHGTWDTLYARLRSVLPGRADDAYLQGLEALDLGTGGIPHFGRLSDELEKLTGWRVVAVPGLVPDEVFFDHLANRRFPAGNFIRKPDQLDYIEEPDVFHDVFGHVPMLTDPVFADYIQAYGEGGLKSLESGALKNLAALYWYTVEFGLIERPEGLRIYGAGIVSSPAESVFALEDPSPNRLGFDTERLLRTGYRIDDFQQTYFVAKSYEDLLARTRDLDFGPIYARMREEGTMGKYSFTPEDVLQTDEIYTRGTQDYAKGGGRAASALA
ncbi:phenylalanine 4-monooxygenase [Parvularcula dongshanensis]|uniref:Phenylalanine-4-hydroxylase n=1 Tax=Parvularcula dongshanensis TaxID=1173995 RepID=A0A840I5A8_9PROT|nr:phenylalanine 4-monooxygenase [Parvularcula dongshanensis]MBB4659210.1 phenylalanine-4-hydroxylase [Parvularcula dongshanensis]